MKITRSPEPIWGISIQAYVNYQRLSQVDNVIIRCKPCDCFESINNRYGRTPTLAKLLIITRYCSWPWQNTLRFFGEGWRSLTGTLPCIITRLILKQDSLLWILLQWIIFVSWCVLIFCAVTCCKIQTVTCRLRKGIFFKILNNSRIGGPPGRSCNFTRLIYRRRWSRPPYRSLGMRKIWNFRTYRLYIRDILFCKYSNWISYLHRSLINPRIFWTYGC